MEADTGSRGLHRAAGSACEHVRRWKTLGSDDPAPEVVQCEPCGFLLVRDLLVQTRLQRAYSRVIVSVAAQGRPQTANCPPVTAPPSSGSSSGAWPPSQLRIILGGGGSTSVQDPPRGRPPPQFRFILGGVASTPVQVHPRGGRSAPVRVHSRGWGLRPRLGAYSWSPGLASAGLAGVGAEVEGPRSGSSRAAQRLWLPWMLGPALS